MIFLRLNETLFIFSQIIPSSGSRNTLQLRKMDLCFLAESACQIFILTTCQIFCHLILSISVNLSYFFHYVHDFFSPGVFAFVVQLWLCFEYLWSRIWAEQALALNEMTKSLIWQCSRSFFCALVVFRYTSLNLSSLYRGNHLLFCRRSQVFKGSWN